VQVSLPHHLRTLARVNQDLLLDVAAPVSLAAVLDALEAAYPMLRGTIREHQSLKRRPMVRFYAGVQDVSHQDPAAPLPDDIVSGAQPLRVIAAISGG
jgi:hypothetical protein